MLFPDTRWLKARIIQFSHHSISAFYPRTAYLCEKTVLTKKNLSAIISVAELEWLKAEDANMAQVVEHILGKDEVPGSNPGISLRKTG